MLGKKIIFLTSLSLIITFGLITIWSTSPSLFSSQITFLIIGSLIFYLIQKVDPVINSSLSFYGYLIFVALLIITLLFAKETRGSTRWLDLGFNFQASEFIKPILVIYFANFLSRHDTTQISNLFKYVLVVALPSLLVFLQPDLGSTLIIIFLGIVMLLANGVHQKTVLVSLIVLIPLLFLSTSLIKPYQMERIKSFIDPYNDPQGAGYHVIQSITAIGSGGLFGKGVKLGTQSHLNFLPERHTDFIFASFVEEFGFLGMILVFLSYVVCMNMLLFISKTNRTKEYSLVTLGVFSLFFFQFVVNIGMNMGLVPVTGITLPLFSYGGSSLITFLILAGISLKLLDLSVVGRL